LTHEKGVSGGKKKSQLAGTLRPRGTLRGDGGGKKEDRKWTNRGNFVIINVKVVRKGARNSSPWKTEIAYAGIEPGGQKEEGR